MTVVGGDMMMPFDPGDHEKLDAAIDGAAAAILRLQRTDGHWVFELEADATIPAEYVLFTHYRGEQSDAALERKIAVYLRRRQGTHGGWPLFQDGPFNLSASIKAYFALKMIGDSPDEAHMVRARDVILAHGGIEQANVFTRFLLALYGILPWRCVPVMPVEIILLPRWFPFHLTKISYWARTVLVPLTVLQALRPVARNPRGIGLAELFAARRGGARSYAPHQKRGWRLFFGALDRVLHIVCPYFPARLRRRATDAAVGFVDERLNGEGGLGAIFPAMVNTVMMYDALGYPPDHPNLVTARAAIDKLLMVKEDEAYCQPCLSPVWDTALVCHALLETGDAEALAGVDRGLSWLAGRQVLDTKGDWAAWRPDVQPGGWAFQYTNPHYPDLDDTAVVIMAMDRADNTQGRDFSTDFSEAIRRGRDWLAGLQSRNGGWGSFDADNDYHYLNNIPFADHGALLDPPTADVTARCVGAFAQLGDNLEGPRLAAALDYLAREQSPDGSWFGRWGMNYIYGTWSVLSALNVAAVDHQAPLVRRAVDWLVSIQNADGGWGEGGESYELDYDGHQPAPSTPAQTAWALLGLMAAGEAGHLAVGRGINYLLARQGADGLWPEARFTATGFPRAFYLRYHGYPKFFPLWALARYRALRDGGLSSTPFGL